VVEVDGAFYAVAATGWTVVDKPTVIQTTVPGSTPIPGTA
jgi:hypothetical protein